jgi:accessory colonization factor AcfC
MIAVRRRIARARLGQPVGKATGAIVRATVIAWLGATSAQAAGTLHVYGPGGPLPAMKEAAAAFGKANDVHVEVTAGPTPQWIDKAKADADLVFSGSEAMMSDLLAALPDLNAATVTPLYLRASVILVRPGNPAHIAGIADLLKPEHRILVVDGSGQKDLWEDVVGRLGDIRTVRMFRSNVTTVAKTSADAKKSWDSDKVLDAWLTWGIRQTASPRIADRIEIEPQYRIYRDAEAALTRRGLDRPEAKGFLTYLSSPQAAAIFAKWGWTAPPPP